MKKIPDVDVTTIEGPIMLDDVANVLLKKADLVVWAGHASDEGLVISDGSILPRDWIVAHISQCAPRAIILAACGTQERHGGLDSLAEAICLSGINAVGFPALADDRTAADFTVEFTRALSLKNGTVAKAFKVAIGFIRQRGAKNQETGLSTADGVFLSPGLRDTPFEVSERLDAIDDRLSRIEQSLFIRYDGAGDEKRSEPTLAPTSSTGLRAVTGVTRSSNIHQIRNMP